MLEASSSMNRIKQFFQTHSNTLSFAVLVISIALCAIAIGFIAASGRCALANFGNVSPLADYARSFQACYFGCAFAGGLGIVISIRLLVSNNKVSDTSTKIRRIVFALGMAVAIFALTMVAVSSAIRNSAAFSDPRNASFYPYDLGPIGKLTFEELSQGLTTNIAVGSTMLIVGIGIVALSFISVIPQKIASWIEHRREVAAKQDAKAELENSLEKS